jgi:hypothetical protein
MVVNAPTAVPELVDTHQGQCDGADWSRRYPSSLSGRTDTSLLQYFKATARQLSDGYWCGMRPCQHSV